MNFKISFKTWLKQARKKLITAERDDVQAKEVNVKEDEDLQNEDELQAYRV